MSRNYRAYNQEQNYLLPPSIKEWVPEDDLSHFVSDAVDQLNLSEFHKRYRIDGKGNAAYDPRMMLKVLIYGYSVGVFSSRKIAKSLERDVAFRMLGAGNFPNFRTINRFRLDNLEQFEKLFVEVVLLAREAGLAKLGVVAVDESKVKANASKRKAMSYSRMEEEEKRLKEEIEQLTAQAQQEDEQEDREHGKDKRGDELPEQLSKREKRLQTIQEAKQRIEQRQREKDKASGRSEDDDKPENRKGRRGPNFKRKFGEPKKEAQDNFTDPESRIMKTSTQGFQQCYNAQTVVDGDEQIIVAADVGDNACDVDQLVPMVDQVEQNTGKKPKRVLADSGYKSESNFEQMKERQITAYVSLGREGKKIEKIASDKKLTKAMKRRLDGTRGKKIYKKRKGIVEPPFGWIKSILGFGGFSLRGLEKVKAEWNLVCLAMNLKRMNQLIQWI